MKITESALRRIIREEMESIDHSKKDLIVQDDDEMQEQELGGGYSVEFGAIPGAERMSRSKLKHRGQRAGRG